MRKTTLCFIVLSLLLLFGCVRQPITPGPETPSGDTISIDSEVSDTDSSMAEIDSIDAELDTSDIDSLESDLLDLDW